MSAAVNEYHQQPPGSPSSRHYGNGPGQQQPFPSSSSNRSLNALRKGSLPGGQREIRGDEFATDEPEPRYGSPVQQPGGAVSHQPAHSQRQNSIDSINFSQMSLNDGQRQRRPSKPASLHDVRPPSRTAGSPYQHQQQLQQIPDEDRAQSRYSNHSQDPQQTSSRNSYGSGSELPYSSKPVQQYQQADYVQGGYSEYGSSDPSMSQYGYQQQPFNPGEDPYYAQQGQYHPQQHPGYSDQNGQYFDPNASQHYASFNPQTQQYDYAGPSNQPYYPGQQPYQPQGDPAGMQSEYAQQMQMQQPGYYEYPGNGPHPEVHRAASGGASSFASSSMNHQQPQPTLARHRTTASTRSAASAAERGGDRSQPITKQAVDEYRNRIKSDPDPETQFNFARFLIEAARRLAVATQSGGGLEDAKSVRKYRDSLLQEALKLVKRLATQGSGLGKPAYADAQFFLANCLGHGALGLTVDHEKAYNLYVQASKQNHPAATYRTAVCNEVGAGTRRDPARAVLFYRKASALGDTAGMYKLGMILLNGLLGQPKNPREAANWLKKAAAQADEENPHALHELAALYEKPQEFLQNGQPVPSPVVRDEAQARELYTQAAQLGHSPSQYKLGSCYEYGSLTCPVEPRRSIAWYTRAAEKGHAESELALSGWYLTGSPDVLKQSDSEAYLWARRAANKGLSKAEYAVGYYSEIGIGVKMDAEEAKMWYLRAAASGNRRAMQRLSELKKLGNKKGGQGQRPTRQQAKDECIIC